MMSETMGVVYYMLPGIVIALVVACGVVLGYRTRRAYLAALLWLAILALAVLVGRLANA